MGRALPSILSKHAVSRVVATFRFVLLEHLRCKVFILMATRSPSFKKPARQNSGTISEDGEYGSPVGDDRPVKKGPRKSPIQRMFSAAFANNPPDLGRTPSDGRASPRPGTSSDQPAEEFQPKLKFMHERYAAQKKEFKQNKENAGATASGATTDDEIARVLADIAWGDVRARLWSHGPYAGLALLIYVFKVHKWCYNFLVHVFLLGLGLPQEPKIFADRNSKIRDWKKSNSNIQSEEESITSAAAQWQLEFDSHTQLISSELKDLPWARYQMLELIVISVAGSFVLVQLLQVLIRWMAKVGEARILAVF